MTYHAKVHLRKFEILLFHSDIQHLGNAHAEL